MGWGRRLGGCKLGLPPSSSPPSPCACLLATSLSPTATAPVLHLQCNCTVYCVLQKEVVWAPFGERGLDDKENARKVRIIQIFDPPEGPGSGRAVCSCADAMGKGTCFRMHCREQEGARQPAVASHAMRCNGKSHLHQAARHAASAWYLAPGRPGPSTPAACRAAKPTPPAALPCFLLQPQPSR